MMSESKCYILTGHDPKFLYKTGRVLKERDFKVFFGFNISWKKTSEAVGLLKRVSSYLENNSETTYLVGSSFSNHVDYLDHTLDLSLEKVCVHTDFKSFFESVKKDFSYGENPFLDNTYKCFPNYDFDPEFSPRDYFRKYYLEVQKNLDVINGKHFLQEDFKNRNKVNTVIKNSLGLKGDIFSELGSFLEEDFNSFEFIRENVKNKRLSSSSGEEKTVLINSFIRPSEFRMFQRQVYELIQSLVFYKNKSSSRNIDLTWRVHMDLSDFYVDWDNSEMRRDYLYSSFYELKGELSSYIDLKFSCFEEDIHGCNDLRRDSVEEYVDSFDSFIWLDPDVVFSRKVLYQLNNFLPLVDDNFGYYGVSPEFLYSESSYLEPLVSDKSLDSKRPSFQDIELVNNNEVSLTKVDRLPICGSFSIISTSFLDIAGIPEELGHYGNDDKYISECFQIFNNYTDGEEHVALYKLNNLIVTQIREKVKEDSSFITYFEYKDDSLRNKHERHTNTQNYLDVLYENFRKRLLEDFYD